MNRKANTVAHADPITPYLGIKRIFRAIFTVAPIARNMGIQFVISFMKIPGNWIT